MNQCDSRKITLMGMTITPDESTVDLTAYKKIMMDMRIGMIYIAIHYLHESV